MTDSSVGAIAESNDSLQNRVQQLIDGCEPLWPGSLPEALAHELLELPGKLADLSNVRLHLQELTGAHVFKDSAQSAAVAASILVAAREVPQAALIALPTGGTSLTKLHCFMPLDSAPALIVTQVAKRLVTVCPP